MWAVASTTLLAGCLDDLRSRKVSNILIIGLFVLVTLANFYFRGIEESIPGVLALILALVMTAPLFSFGVLGGGDVKLFAVFAFALDPMSMFWTLVYSFFWGALFGFTRASVEKQLPMLVRNTYRLSRLQKLQSQSVQKIPYTFALLLGWFTQLTFMRYGALI